MPDQPGRGEASASGPRQLLAAPLVTGQDVLDRVAAIVVPAAAGDTARTLWLFLLDAQGLQADLVFPVGGIPERPSAQAISKVCCFASEVLTRCSPGGSVVITLSRPGMTALTGSDLHLLRALQHGASAHSTPVRMLCLATPAGVRELGPASPAAGTPAGPREPGI